MADEPDNTISTCWNDVLVDYQVAKAAAEAVSNKPACRVREQIFETFAETVRTIQHTSAPDLTAIVEKLQVYWRAGDLADGSYGNDFRRKIIGDLRRIERQRAGVAEPHASGGMDIRQVEHRWAETLRDYDHYSRLLAEGPPGKKTWSGKTATETTVKRDEAEAMLLSLPAPNLAAVIQKLDILWENDDWFGPIADTSLHAALMGELQRFALDENDRP